MTDRFGEVAAAYAAHRPPYPPALIDFLADAAPACGLAWDAGCGSGQLSVPLARRFDQVVATDTSAEQLAHAVAHPRVAYRRLPAAESGLSPGAADLAVAAQAAHWFDLPAYYAEVRRVAQPGAVVALVTYPVVTIDERVDAVVRRFHGGVLGPYWAPERRHVDERYRSLPFPFDELAAPALEMRAEWTAADLMAYVETWSAVRALERALGRGPIEAFGRDLADAWGVAGARTARWPLALRVGRC